VFLGLLIVSSGGRGGRSGRGRRSSMVQVDVRRLQPASSTSVNGMGWTAARLNKVVHSSVHRAACPVSRRTFGPSVASTQMCLASFLFKFGPGNPIHQRPPHGAVFFGRLSLRRRKPYHLQQARQHHASAALGSAWTSTAPLHCHCTADLDSTTTTHTRARCTRSQAPHRRSVPCVQFNSEHCRADNRGSTNLISKWL
jgi:hypothetical protein